MATVKDMKARNLRKRRIRAESKRNAILKPAPFPKKFTPYHGPALSQDNIVKRIIDVLVLKRTALEGMQYKERAKGLEIAAAEVAVLCMSEFGIPVDEKLLGDYR